MRIAFVQVLLPWVSANKNNKDDKKKIEKNGSDTLKQPLQADAKEKKTPKTVSVANDEHVDYEPTPAKELLLMEMWSRFWYLIVLNKYESLGYA